MAGQDSLQGSLPLLLLKILARRGPLHGYGITTQIETVSDEVLCVEEGSLYPALHRLEECGWVKAKWITTENNRRARVYESRPRAGNNSLRNKTAGSRLPLLSAKCSGGHKCVPDIAYRQCIPLR